MERMRADGGGIAILPTAPKPSAATPIPPYRLTKSDFFYLHRLPDGAWLVLIAGARRRRRALLFCRPRHVEHEITGRRFRPQAAT